MREKIYKVLCTSLMITTLLENTIAYANDDTQNTETETFNLVTTDLKTGEKTIEEIAVSNEKDVLEGEPLIKMQAIPNRIIDEDDRTEVPDFLMSFVPYSTIGVVRVYYEDGRVKRGTGFLIGPNDVVTAAHVIASDGVSYFTFSFPNDITKTYTCNVMSVPQEYYDTQAFEYDWAVLEINEDVGNTRGYCGWSTDISVGDTVQVIGYPGDKPNGLWMAGKQVKKLNEYLMYYDVDAVVGQSGAPVIKAGTTGICAGVHVGETSTLNVGTRVTDRMASVFNLCREH